MTADDAEGARSGALRFSLSCLRRKGPLIVRASGRDATGAFSSGAIMIRMLMFTIAENTPIAIGKNSYCSRN